MPATHPSQLRLVWRATYMPTQTPVATAPTFNAHAVALKPATRMQAPKPPRAKAHAAVCATAMSATISATTLAWNAVIS